MADNGLTEQVIAHDQSVKKEDFAKGAMTWVFPAFGYTNAYQKGTVLPKDLPMYSRYEFYSSRQVYELRSPYHESFWALTIGTAVSKGAAWGWEVSGAVPLRRKRLQSLLQHATCGILVGFVPFISAHLRSFLLTGMAIFEIERANKQAASTITGLHHLNPLRCRLTDNPREPVEYLDRAGDIHRMRWHDVIILADNPDPTEGDVSLVQSSTDRAWRMVTTLEAAHLYLYEKLTGDRPLALEFLQGISERHLAEAVNSNQAESARSGNVMFRGVTAIPIYSDVPINRVTIPIAEVPDGFDYQTIYDNAIVGYAGFTGQDVNDLDPRLAQRMSLGSGAQAIVLDQKAKGKGLAAWKADFANNVHRLLADLNTKFTWSELTVEDETREAQLVKARADARKAMQDNQEITPDQSRNMAADAGDIPREYLDQDLTPTNTVADDEPTESSAEDDSEAPKTEALVEEERGKSLTIAEAILEGFW